MQHEIVYGPSFALLKVHLQPQQTVTAEAGAMVTRTSSIHMHTRLNAPRDEGFWGAFKAFCVALVRKALGGETMFINDFTADAAGTVTLAPAMSGAISHQRLQGGSLLLWQGAFLAADPAIRLKTRWGGLRGLLSREGLFFIEASGTGDVFFQSYGGIHPVRVENEFIVDTGHIVAFEGQLDFHIQSAGGGVMGFVASGEGLVCRFTGSGTVYVQSRNVSALVDWVSGYLP